jgi:hypothetical protein
MSQMDVREAWQRFAAEEARGRSPIYERLAQSVACDPDLPAWLATLPPAKRQPNLLLAAVRLLFGTIADPGAFRRAALDAGDRLRAVMLARTTQTNEPGRCATLLPVLARLQPPLALIEVGASAGLCLLPDQYAYDFGRAVLGGPSGAPVFPCRADIATPLPASAPPIIWRAGLDLAPVDLTDPDQRAWLEALVWPEQTERLGRLQAAMALAAQAPPRVVRGDLRHDLATLAAEAPRGATRVIFHTAVLAYLRSPSEREDFARSVREHCDIWIANEAPRVLPAIAALAPPAPHGRFLLSVNGAPVAWTDPHGAAIDWIADPPAGGR